jgi:cytochrome c1
MTWLLCKMVPKLFVNYCLNCHSAAFMRFNRLKDIGLTDQQIKDNLLFTDRKSRRNHEGCD